MKAAVASRHLRRSSIDVPSLRQPEQQAEPEGETTGAVAPRDNGDSVLMADEAIALRGQRLDRRGKRGSQHQGGEQLHDYRYPTHAVDEGPWASADQRQSGRQSFVHISAA